MLKSTSLILFSALALTGCFGEIGRAEDPWGFEPGPAPDPYYGGTDEIGVSNAALSGELSGYSAGETTWVENAYGGANFASVELRSAGEGVLMNMLSIEGNIEAGNTYRSNGEWDSGSDIYLSMIGCAGSTNGVWDVDVPADEVEIQVEEGPEEGTVSVAYRARFGRDTSSGSFVMAN